MIAAWFVVMLYRLHMGPINLVRAVPVNSPTTGPLRLVARIVA
jgi:hypothetical protein